MTLSFQNLLCPSMSSDVTDVWPCDLVTLTLTLVLKIENGKENQKKTENRKEKENKLSLLLLSLTIEFFCITQYKNVFLS